MTIRKLEVVANGIRKETIQLKTNGNRDIEVIKGKKTLQPGNYSFTPSELKNIAQHRAESFYGKGVRVNYC
jgi:hypothetical protein